jgi:hemerythrin-like domain-containing protein
MAKTPQLREDIARQMLVENQMLNYITEGLRQTLSWKLREGDFTRKLSTLRFMSQSFQRHLEHLLALEEFDGYMDQVLQHSPHLSKNVDTLKADHERLRRGARLLMQRLERAGTDNAETFQRICEDFREYLRSLESHNRSEAALLQEAFEREAGGEGG